MFILMGNGSLDTLLGTITSTVQILGIEKKGRIKVNHKYHIPKVMVIVVNGYAFKNGFKGGGVVSILAATRHRD